MKDAQHVVQKIMERLKLKKNTQTQNGKCNVTIAKSFGLLKFKKIILRLSFVENNPMKIILKE